MNENPSHRRVLIVDDDKDFAQSIAARCRALGLEAQTASNALTAVTVVGVRPPDLLVLDVEMPTGSGLLVLEFILNDPSTSRIPVIVVTGRKDPGTVRRCLELRAAYVHKSPNMWPQLRSAISERLAVCCDKSHAMQNV